MPIMPWTEKEEETMKKMAAMGKTADDVGRVLISRTRNAIMSKASKMRLSLSGGTGEIDMAEFDRIMKGKS